uniref:Methyltransferase domain-containing protein n=1 Tax=Candidatus Kentrum sp. DK TaxID=2126562 RepID=A0A450SIZ3_9GAMM|nr:MAG: Methyltransferase domain-containing protein [Candidatus Kentron sp. DK]
MKARDSGMPEEKYWSSFFDAECIIKRLFGGHIRGDIVEFGSGYGTFTLPAAKDTDGRVFALDIEANSIERLHREAEKAAIGNIRAEVRDFVADGTGLNGESQAHAMIYNLLHLENPVALLNEAHRVLRPGGVLSVIHWRSDIPTPRGPAPEIRPTPALCREWMENARFRFIRNVELSECCRFHFGMVAIR